MGLINGSLQIGRSALLTQQAAMQVIGNNIANAGDPNYTRQTARLSPTRGARLPDGSDPGAGVQMVGIQRHIDQALEERLRGAISDVNYDGFVERMLSRLESLYNEMTDSDLSSSLSEFFNAWSQLQSQPHDMSTRAVVVQVAESLTNQIKILREDVVSAYNDLGTELTEVVGQINFLTGRVAELNVEITNMSAAGKSPSAVLDQRDAVLKELSELANIHVAEQPAGDVMIYLGSEPLVQYNNARQLTIERDSNGELLVPKIAFADTGAQASIRAGKTGAIIYLIDDFVTSNLQQLDSLGGALIYEVNKIHSSGQGLSGYSTITSERAVTDPTTALDQAGLIYSPQNGSFVITVGDANTDQIAETRIIRVDLNGSGTDMSLNDVVAQIDAMATLSATVLPNGRLQIQGTSGNYTFTFSDDDSYLLASMGLNGFFHGSSSANIEVNPEVLGDIRLLAAAQNNVAGDGSNAQQIAQLQSAAGSTLGGLSVPEFYRSMISDLATRTGSARQSFAVHQATTDTLQAQRESTSGVSINEETIALMTSQQAFQGAARFISVINQLMQEVLRLI